ncbi:substrate-binding domain-containing protein [Luteolibacter arcticus]|uniref:Substrate-binding domain-containing protein n=2 Tax=Luteolibacter arcticus TaxID=1581411 RepID=A0ABT3GS20_9BACT|nr:substrate-binding domain-containing protein [Luteolibacter arcticus]
MARIERRTTAEIAADAIKSELAAGRWTGRLPGSRLLAAETGVSQPTVAAALALLVEQGWLESGGDRRAFRVIPRAAVAPQAPARILRRAVVATHADLGDLPHTARRVIEVTREKLGRRGWAVEIVTFDFLHAKRPHRSWDHLLPIDPDVPVIAVFGRPPIGEWAMKNRVRMIFLGGLVGEWKIPIVAVKSSLLAAEAMERLTRQGHRQIVLPLCDRPHGFSASIKEAVKAGLERVGVSYVESYHTPESPYQRPEVVWNMVEAAMDRAVPTALILLDWKELVTVSCLLTKRGLRVPDDVSLILLNEQMEADWYVPHLACFRFPVMRLANLLTRWVEGQPLDQSKLPLSADFEAGESIAAPQGWPA